MKKRLARRLCAIIMAAVFLVVMTLSFVEPLHGMLVIGAGLALMAALVTYESALAKGHNARAGPHMTPSSGITNDTISAAALGMAQCIWPDPDQLTYRNHNLSGHMNGSTRLCLSTMRFQKHPKNAFRPYENVPYNARDQTVQVLHFDKCARMSTSGYAGLRSYCSMTNPNTIQPIACAA